MARTNAQLEELARRVDFAAEHAEPLTMLTAEIPELTLEEAYTIQRASMRRRVDRGEAVIGMKMGLTSKAKMEQMGVHDPIYGHLTDRMRLTEGATISRSEFCHPRIEPEIAFLLARDLRGAVTPGEALAAVGGVTAALEIIDSRYRDFKFTLIDVVADNASSTGFVLGTRVFKPDMVDLSNLGMVLSRNGQIEEVGSSAAILEHPARSLAALATMLAERDEGLHAGQIVLAGGATRAIPLHPGDHIQLEVDQLGTVELRVR
jgi:2-oxo-3-hexenedioate decarboxylase